MNLRLAAWAQLLLESSELAVNDICHDIAEQVVEKPIHFSHQAPATSQKFLARSQVFGCAALT
jgi:hypothetical protein